MIVYECLVIFPHFYKGPTQFLFDFRHKVCVNSGGGAEAEE